MNLNITTNIKLLSPNLTVPVRVNNIKCTFLIISNGSNTITLFTSIDGENYIPYPTSIECNAIDNIEIGGITPRTFIQLSSTDPMTTVKLLH